MTFLEFSAVIAGIVFGNVLGVAFGLWVGRKSRGS
jgi:hypothetical protein